MPAAVILLALLAAQDAPRAEKVPPRFNVAVDPDVYPQKTPKDTVRSVLKAIEAKKFDYLLAQLAEPEYVDQFVKDAGGKFADAVRIVADKHDRDPETARQLRQFLSDGEWTEDGDTASAKAADVGGRHVFLKKIGDRWFLLNKTRPDPAK